MSKFTCDLCHETHDIEKDWTEEDKLKEMEENFGNLPEEERSVVCDDCYKKMIEAIPPKEFGEGPFVTVEDLGSVLFPKLGRADVERIKKFFAPANKIDVRRVPIDCPEGKVCGDSIEDLTDEQCVAVAGSIFLNMQDCIKQDIEDAIGGGQNMTREELYQLNYKYFNDAKDDETCPCPGGGRDGLLYVNCCKDWWLNMKRAYLAESAAGDVKKQYEIWITQGQGSVFVKGEDTIYGALDYVDDHKGEGSFAIKYPDGTWHGWQTGDEKKDEEMGAIFDQWKLLNQDIQNIAGIVQNPMDITEEMIKEWWGLVNAFQSKVVELKKTTTNFLDKRVGKKIVKESTDD